MVLHCQMLPGMHEVPDETLMRHAHVQNFLHAPDSCLIVNWNARIIVESEATDDETAAEVVAFLSVAVITLPTNRRQGYASFSSRAYKCAAENS